MPQSVTFHDLQDPFTGERTSLRLAGGEVAERAPSVAAGQGADVDGSELWILPALYDADAHLPLVSPGRRRADEWAALHGGTARVNVALQWQEIRDLDVEALVRELATPVLPRITPILSVHSDQDSTGFGDWLAANADLVRTLLPPVCKLYSYGDGFWDNLDAVFAAGLLPIIYCKDFSDVEAVVARASGPVHFRHAVSEQLVKTMRQLPGATLQTSPHFLLPLEPEQRAQLYVLPPVPDDDVRQGLLDRFLDEIDLVVTDHNGPPLEDPTGPGLQVAQDFLSTLLTASDRYGWPLDQVWAKATSAPAARFGVELGETFVVVDPAARREVGLWPPRQTVDRAPYLGITLLGRVLAIGSDGAATLV
ncbi:MAG: hypothetical protein JWN46_1829 [Acidimicrobiales bacterium]|nr:hypothetical protein [Acidimicrobiales bacterium]